jgi:hypothetical protein
MDNGGDSYLHLSTYIRVVGETGRYRIAILDIEYSCLLKIIYIDLQVQTFFAPDDYSGWSLIE